MQQTYCNNNNIYSVDMMFAYINIYKPKSKYIEISTLQKTLEYDCWGIPEKNIKYSPMDVLANPNKKMYKEEIERINNANLKFPIIIEENGHHVVDGVHRLVKASLQKNIKIKAYVFSKEEMKKFLLSRKKDWNKINNLKIYDYIKLFYEKFCIKN